MSAVDLYGELKAASASVRQKHLDRMAALGLRSAVVDFCADNLMGVAEAEPIGHGHYQPGGGGVHIVLPVHEDEHLVDLCAFRPSSPGDWLTRCGVGWALGLKRGLGWHTFGKPLHIFATPLDWLLGGCEGIAVIDWSSREIRSNLAGLPLVNVDDAATGALLRSALTRPVRLPEIQILGGLSHVA